MIPIMNRPTVPHARLAEFATAKSATVWYFKALVALWDAGIDTGVDPTVLAAQCAHETGWGKFGGAVTPDFGNTGGMKVRNATGDMPDDHARFAISRDGFPYVGSLAHADHLRLYAGFPVPDDTSDERAIWIGPGTSKFGSAKYVEELGGRWAPDPSYGNRVAKIVLDMQTFARG